MISWIDKYMAGEKLDEPICFPKTNPGERYKRDRILKTMDDGRGEIVTTGKTDLYAYIQSHKDSVDINKIIARYRAGDVTALDRQRAVYLDITQIPDNYHDIVKFVKNADTFFNSLPLKVREEYNFNPQEFVNDIGTDHFKSMFMKEEEKPAAPEVTENA